MEVDWAGTSQDGRPRRRGRGGVCLSAREREKEERRNKKREPGPLTYRRERSKKGGGQAGEREGGKTRQRRVAGRDWMGSFSIEQIRA